MSKFIDGTYQNPYITVQVTNILNSGIWVVHVAELGWVAKLLDIPGNSTQEQAEHKALYMVKTHLRKMYDSLEFPEAYHIMKIMGYQ